MLGKKDDATITKTGDLNTIIGKGSKLEGTLVVENSVRIDGKIKGNITTNDFLVIGKQGEVEGEIVAKNAVVGGKVVGKITTSGKVVLEARAIFHGEMKAARLVIDDGAIFDGQCQMKELENSNIETKPTKKTPGSDVS